MTSQHQEEDQHDQQDCEEDGYGTPLAPIWKAGHRGDLPGLGTPSLRNRYPNISEAEEEQSRSCSRPGTSTPHAVLPAGTSTTLPV